MQTTKNLFLKISLFLLLTIGTFAQGFTKDKIFRGFMIDTPRGIETMEYYFRLIDFCQEKEINSIIFRLADDQGSAYLFTSHPELNRCEGAFNAQELKTLVTYAQKRGIEVIPEIESFGHSSYITKTKKYQFLNDGPAGADFNALCPVNDTTVNLMNDLYAEVAAIFPSAYYHIGCDEVNWGAGEASKNALKTKSKHQIWGEYVNKLNKCLNVMGKKTLSWGDVPIYQDRAVLDLLDKNIVIIDWNYWEYKKEIISDVAQTVLGRGFKLIGCPAVSWCGWGLRVGENQFKNISAYAEVYDKLNNPNNLGIILANWDCQRYLQGSNWDSYAIAAGIIKNKSNYNLMDAIPLFVKNHFGANYNSDWENVYRTLYKETPQWLCGATDSLKFFPWYSEKHIQRIILKGKQTENKYGELIHLLLQCSHSVTLNKGDFNNFLLTIEFIKYCYDRQNDLLVFAQSGQADLKSVENYFKKVASTDQTQLSKITSAWKVGRRSNPYLNGVDDNDFMWSFYVASRYSKHLSENPAEFIKILKEGNK